MFWWGGLVESAQSVGAVDVDHDVELLGQHRVKVVGVDLLPRVLHVLHPDRSLQPALAQHLHQVTVDYRPTKQSHEREHHTWQL
jgi:hypothetical protein